MCAILELAAEREREEGEVEEEGWREKFTCKWVS